MSAKTEELRARLEDAQRELAKLLEEQDRIDRDLDHARREDAAALLDATRSGGRIASAVKTLASKARNVALRRESLPDLVWTARVRAAELEAEYLQAAIPELEEKSDAARAETAQALEAIREAEARHRGLEDASIAALREVTEKGNRLSAVRLERDALLKAGPRGAYRL